MHYRLVALRDALGPAVPAVHLMPKRAKGKVGGGAPRCKRTNGTPAAEQRCSKSFLYAAVEK